MRNVLLVVLSLVPLALEAAEVQTSPAQSVVSVLQQSSMSVLSCTAAGSAVGIIGYRLEPVSGDDEGTVGHFVSRAQTTHHPRR